MNEIEILCVDDDIRMLNTIEDILINAGYAVTLAKSGRQALEFLKKGLEYRLILLDIDMPEMDGYETFEEIRKIEAARNTPIIFLTGMKSDDFQIKGWEYGAVDYITKPFIKSIFLARIKNMISAPVPMEKYNQKALAELEAVLSDTELMIAKCVADGLTNREISSQMHYAYGYVKKVVSLILEKTYLKNRSDIRKYLKAE